MQQRKLLLKVQMLLMKRFCINSMTACWASNESFVELTSLLAVSEQSRANRLSLQDMTELFLLKRS